MAFFKYVSVFENISATLHHSYNILFKNWFLLLQTALGCVPELFKPILFLAVLNLDNIMVAYLHTLLLKICTGGGEALVTGYVYCTLMCPPPKTV